LGARSVAQLDLKMALPKDKASVQEMALLFENLQMSHLQD
jgi:hypothetical protein